MKKTTFLTILLVGLFINTTLYATTFLDEVCEKQRCSSTSDEYKIGNISISTEFYGPVDNEKDKYYSNYIHRACIKVKQENKILWEYNEILEANGGEVGLSEGVFTPDKMKIIFHVMGNYSNKLLIVSVDGSVDMIDGSNNYTLEDDGKLLFTSLIEDTPVGFQIYDFENKKVVFKTDKFITQWSNKSNGVYDLQEQEWEEGTFKNYLLTITANGININQVP